MKQKPFFFYRTEAKNFATRFMRKTSGILGTNQNKKNALNTGLRSQKPGNEEQNAASEKWVGYLRDFTGLTTGCHVLEAGCSKGETAFMLTTLLGPDGCYQGFDQSEHNIFSCSENISGRFPHFKFQHIRIQLDQQTYLAETSGNIFKLPCQDQSFDIVFAKNELTLMLPYQLDLFLPEIGRVMKPGGTCLLMMYIVNCESENLMITKPTSMNFRFNKGLYRLQSKETQTQVAYDEEWLLEKVENAGLKLESIKYGSWCGRKSYLDFADMLICSKV